MDPAKRQIFRDASGRIFSLKLRPFRIGKDRKYLASLVLPPQMTRLSPRTSDEKWSNWLGWVCSKSHNSLWSFLRPFIWGKGKVVTIYLCNNYSTQPTNEHFYVPRQPCSLGWGQQWKGNSGVVTDDNDDNDGGGDDDNDDDGGDDEEPVTARVLPSPILSIVGKPLHLPISSTSTKLI